MNEDRPQERVGTRCEAMSSRLNRLFDRSIVRADEPDGFATWVPAMDVEETDKEYRIKADLPDVAKSDVRVGIQDGVLTIEGERKQEKEDKGKKYHRVERTYGKFVRRLTVPSDAIPSEVVADFKDDVLNVRLPKSTAATSRAIDVKIA